MGRENVFCAREHITRDQRLPPQPEQDGPAGARGPGRDVGAWDPLHRARCTDVWALDHYDERGNRETGERGGGKGQERRKERRRKRVMRVSEGKEDVS